MYIFFTKEGVSDLLQLADIYEIKDKIGMRVAQYTFLFLMKIFGVIPIRSKLGIIFQNISSYG